MRNCKQQYKTGRALLFELLEALEGLGAFYTLRPPVSTNIRSTVNEQQPIISQRHSTIHLHGTIWNRLSQSRNKSVTSRFRLKFCRLKIHKDTTRCSVHYSCSVLAEQSICTLCCLPSLLLFFLSIVYTMLSRK